MSCSWYGHLVNSLVGKVESPPHCLSSSWEETLLLALSHLDMSPCCNPHNRSQTYARANRELNTHPDMLLYTPITREQWAFLTSRPPLTVWPCLKFGLGNLPQDKTQKRSIPKRRVQLGRVKTTFSKAIQVWWRATISILCYTTLCIHNNSYLGGTKEINTHNWALFYKSTLFSCSILI